MNKTKVYIVYEDKNNWFYNENLLGIFKTMKAAKHFVDEAKRPEMAYRIECRILNSSIIVADFEPNADGTWEVTEYLI